MIPIARPRIVVEGGEVFYIFRDEERGSRVSMAHATDVGTSKWTITDLTDFRWMPGNPLMIRNFGKSSGNCISLYNTPVRETVNAQRKLSLK